MERTGAGKHFIENATQRKNVGASVLRAAHDLFGAPISGRAEERAAAGVAAGDASHAEVRKLNAAVRGDENISGFDVAVNDSLAMCDAERSSNVANPGARAGKRDRTFFQNAIKRLAIHKFHDEIGRLRHFVDTHVMQGENAGMRDLSDDARFLEKLLAGFASGDFRGENLDGDDASDERIMRANDAAEGASADGVEDFVTANFHGGPFQKPRESLAIVRIEKGNVGENEAEVLLKGYSSTRTFLL